MRPLRPAIARRTIPLVILLAAQAASAGDVQVVSPGDSLQDAIDNAELGGVVHVLPGNYEECITVPAFRSVTLLGLDGSDETSIVCGLGSRTVDVTGTLQIRGFTIQHVGLGGGIEVTGDLLGQELVFEDMPDSTVTGVGISVLSRGNATLLEPVFRNLATTENGGAFATDIDGVLTLLGGTAQNTSAAGDGGAGYVRDGVVTTVGLVIDGGAGDDPTVSARNGGGIYVATSGDLSLIDTIVTGAHAREDGGGIFVEDRASGVVGTNLMLSGNTAGRDGGGAFVLGDLILRGGTVTGNEAAEAGGGLYLDGSEVTLLATSVRENMAHGQPTDGAYPSGGGAFVDGGSLNSGDILWEANNAGASGLGGALYITGGAEWSSTGDELRGNIAAAGGAVWANDTDLFEMVQGVVEGNEASGLDTDGDGAPDSSGEAGGIRLSHDSSISSTLFVFNSAAGNGGAVSLAENVAAPMLGVVFQDNTTQADGGGIHAADGSWLSVSGGWFEANEALSGQGGGIRFDGTDADGGLTLDSVHLVRNRAERGAGISMDHGVLDMHPAWVYENVASSDGGGIELNATEGSTVAETVFCANSAAGRGGGVYMNLSEAERLFQNVVLQDNTATTAGGAVYDAGNAPDIDDVSSFLYSTIVGNQATGPFPAAAMGGLVIDAEVDNQASFSIVDSIFLDNGEFHLATYGDGVAPASFSYAGNAFWGLTPGVAYNADDLIGVDRNEFTDPGITGYDPIVTSCLVDDLTAENSDHFLDALTGIGGLGIGAGVWMDTYRSLFAEEVGVNDGFQLAQGDCDPDSPFVSPAAAEIPDSGTDEDCWLGDDLDGDGDTFLSEGEGGADCVDTITGINPSIVETYGDGADSNCDNLDDLDEDGDHLHIWIDTGEHDSSDCDDQDLTIGPSAIDFPYDGIDQNCDEADDFDADEDGTADGDDCDDLDESINPEALETWYDGIDQDCDGENDFDQDGDGAVSDGFDGTDCNDLDSDINPDAEDIPYNGLDEDCSGSDIEDQDQDGYLAEAVGGDDCDDLDPDVNPGAIEQIDGFDNDCDDVIDPDTDGDGILDFWEEEAHTDLDDEDSDDDLIPDGEEWGDDLANPVDTDNDGTPDVLDSDSDDDSVADSLEGTDDTDGDGTPDYRDVDDDGDGIDTLSEYDNNVDSDNDGTPDYLDTDSDQDGVVDGIDPDRYDRGGDGTGQKDPPTEPDKYGFGCNTSGSPAGGWLALLLLTVGARRRQS